jgi:hypothetical protein
VATCKSNGHLFGTGRTCIFCGIPKPEHDSLQNPRGLSRQIVSILVSANRCAKCLGGLDAGLECSECGYAWTAWINASKAISDAAFDKREG